MSVTKDGKTGKWMSQLRITDWTGNVIHKKKRGFDTKREALEWEHEFIMQASGSVGMTFADFIKLYFEDMEKRLKPSTVANKRWLIDLKITPYFEKKALNVSEVNQQSAHCYIQLCGKVLRTKRKSLP